MGLINRFTKKCVFCGSRKDTKYITAFGDYGGSMPGNWYHPFCLNEVACYPEKYKHRVVDMALDIIERLETMKEKIKNKADTRKGEFDRLKSFCT